MSGVVRTLVEDTKLEEIFCCGVCKGLFPFLSTPWQEMVVQSMWVENSMVILVVVYVKGERLWTENLMDILVVVYVVAIVGVPK